MVQKNRSFELNISRSGQFARTQWMARPSALPQLRLGVVPQQWVARCLDSSARQGNHGAGVRKIAGEKR